jgi:hypothetical protein
MSDPAALRELMERVRKDEASGDKALGFAVHRALLAPNYPADDYAGFYGHSEVRLNPLLSVDAALSVAERVLTTYSLQISIDPSGNGAKLTWWPLGLSEGVEFRGEHVTGGDTALAIVGATLAALLSQANPNV